MEALSSMTPEQKIQYALMKASSVSYSGGDLTAEQAKALLAKDEQKNRADQAQRRVEEALAAEGRGNAAGSSGLTHAQAMKRMEDNHATAEQKIEFSLRMQNAPATGLTAEEAVTQILSPNNRVSVA